MNSPAPHDIMTGLLADLTQSARRLAAVPGFTIATILSIGLGVGVNASVFTAANELLLKPLAVPRSGELVRVYRGHHSPLGGRELRAVQSGTSFAQVFGETTFGATFTVGGSTPERVRASLASDNLFRGLELMPAAGRLFVDGAAEQAGQEVVLAHEFWLRRFGGDRRVVGQGVRLNDHAFTVIGVAPAGRSSAQLGWWADVIVPTRDAKALTGRVVDSIQGSFYVTARLAPHVTLAQADAELAVIAARISRADSSDRALQGSGAREYSLRARPARGVTEEMRLPATMASGFLLAVALLVLVIAATNVGNLMLARNATRRRELSVRMALGASRSRLMRFLLSEAAVLAVLAASVAWLLAAWSAALLPQLLPADAEVRFVLSPDWRVFAFTVLAAGVAMLVFGLIPTREALRRDLVEGIKEGASIGHGVDGARLRRRFLVVQVALCALLLTTGSLFLRSLGRASSVNLGFRPQGIVTATLDIGGRQLGDVAQVAFFDRLLAEVRASTGVESATYSRIVELTGSNSETGLTTDVSPDSAQARSVYFNTVGADYHRTLGIPLLSGRDFALTDGASAPRVVIVNETLAAREWPGLDPLGHRVSFAGPAGPWYEVIGVSRNVKYHTLGEDAKPFVTVPQGQWPSSDLALEVRVAPGASARDIMATIVRVTRTLDPLVAPPRTELLTTLQSVALLPARASAAVLGGIGALAFLLAAVGVAGVAAFTVTQRRREIGVRVALGAPPAALLRSILGDTWRAVAIGAVIGLALALGVGRLIAGQLYGVSFADPVTFIAVPIVLLVLAAGAAWRPARRVMAIAPTEALKSE